MIITNIVYYLKLNKMTIPSPIYLYRIIHINNLPIIIANKGITCPSHSYANTDYIRIGDDSLIAHRREMPIRLNPGGTFDDYVAFYFGRRSPMLYNIKNGYHHLSQIFNTEEGFAHIDWRIINASKWFDTWDDPDRKRRKQAEFLIYKSLPIEALIALTYCFLFYK